MKNILKLHNSLSRRKENFEPIDPSNVRVYNCGPTVYSYTHIGNARAGIVSDQLVRVLRAIYPKVTYVSNITDIDDKIMKAADESGEDINAITTKYTDIYNADMAALGAYGPDIQPRATDHIPEMINIITTLIDKGHAYEAEGHVLFHVPSYPAYGRLSGRSRDEQIAGARVDVAPFKRDPADFVLWKPSTSDQIGWDSPWGRGRPGWHIECSAMSAKALGLPFDIHTGGLDLTFPHHENEIAQSCCACDVLDDPKAYVKYWLHNGFLMMGDDKDKMSKSLGNVIITHDLLKDHKGEVLRLALLSAHYKQPLSWTDSLLAQTKKTLDRLYRVLYDLRDLEVTEQVKPDPKFMDALLDDLNTPQAISVLSLLSQEKDDKTRKKQLLACGALMGVLQDDPATWLGYNETSDDIDALVNARNDARKNKDFAEADRIRDILKEQGIEIEDTAQGTVWKKL